MFHGIGGEVLSFEPLVRHLHSGRPIYGLEGEGVNFKKGSSLQIESMASRYLDAMRKVQTSGPYFLAGYSAGGITAYEIARQLHAAGEGVGLLAILDGDAPPSVRKEASWTPRTLAQFAVNLAWWTADDLLESGAADIKARVRSKLRLLRSRPMATAPGSQDGHRWPDVRDTASVYELPEQYIPWLEAYVDAINNYRPGSYPGRITLFRARAHGLFQRAAPDRGWNALAQDVDVRVIKGNHATIMKEPLVGRLAEELENALAV
jgi:thioesterase domain-containing protein